MRALRRVLPLVLAVPLLAAVPGSTAAGPPRCGSLPATVVGTNGPDTLTGTKQADVIVGLGSDDVIDGLAGDDVLCGGPGADRLVGGAGHDSVYGGLDRLGDGPGGTYLVGDMLLGGAGDDLLDGGNDQRSVDNRRRPDTFSWVDSPAGVVVDLSGELTPGSGTSIGEGSDTIVLGDARAVQGSAYADSITGSSGSDRVYGGPGPDTITTGGGADLVYPDGLEGYEGRDVVDTGRGDDLVSSLTGRDQISAGGGADFVEAFSPEPTSVDMGAGDDYLGQNIAPGNGALAQAGVGEDTVAFYGNLLAEQSPDAMFTIDYRTGVTSVTGDVPATGTIEGFDRHRLIGPLRWRYFGSDLPERVWAIQGGPLRARMGDGTDELTGTPLDDLLDGGTGTDAGYGRGGDDDCRNVERGDC